MMSGDLAKARAYGARAIEADPAFSTASRTKDLVMIIVYISTAILLATVLAAVIFTVLAALIFKARGLSG
jgi:hypothetical protein